MAAFLISYSPYSYITDEMEKYDNFLKIIRKFVVLNKGDGMDIRIRTGMQQMRIYEKEPLRLPFFLNGCVFGRCPAEKSGYVCRLHVSELQLLEQVLYGELVLDDTVYVYRPDFIIGILEILKTIAQLRLFGGLGGGGCFLNGTRSIYQILHAVQINRCVA